MALTSFAAARLRRSPAVARAEMIEMIEMTISNSINEKPASGADV
jgi:hypothetical protein